MTLDLPQFRNTPALPPSRAPLAPTSVAAGGIAPTTSNKKGMRDIKLTLDGVNSQVINAQGDYFMVQAVGTAGANILLSFDDGPFVTRQLGDGNRIQYSKITVTADQATTLTLQVGFGYAVKTSGAVNANVSASIAPAAHNPALPQVSIGAGLQAKILAANVNGLGASFKIPSMAANGLWLGDVNAANGVGYYLEPGEGITVYTDAAVYAYNAGAGAVDITIMSLTK